MKQVPLFSEYVFDEVIEQNVIGANATLEEIERGLLSKHEVTRNKWHSVAMVKGIIQ